MEFLNSTSVHLICATILLACGAFHAWSYFQLQRDFSLVHVVFWLTIIFFGLGPWFCAIYGGDDAFSQNDVNSLLFAYAGVGLFLGGLLFTDAVIRSCWKTPYTGSPLGETYRQAIQIPALYLGIIYASIWLVRGVLGTKYGMFVSGTQTDDLVKQLPYFLVVTKAILDVMAYACLLWASGVFWKQHSKKGFAGLILLGEFSWLFLQGRRWILAFFIIVAIGMIFCRRRITWRFALVGILGAGFLGGVAFPMFYEFRLVYWEYYDQQDAISGIRKALKELRLSPVQKEQQKNYRENMQERPLIIRFNADILEAQKEYGPMLGKATTTSLLWVIPSAFNPRKFDMLKDEETIQDFYHMRVIDTSSNWAAFGCADFGVFGGFLAGLFLGTILTVGERFAAYALHRSAFFPLCLFGGMMGVATSVEETPEWSFSIIRSLIILFVLERVFFMFRKAIPFRSSCAPAATRTEVEPLQHNGAPS